MPNDDFADMSQLNTRTSTVTSVKTDMAASFYNIQCCKEVQLRYETFQEKQMPNIHVLRFKTSACGLHRDGGKIALQASIKHCSLDV